MRRVIVPLMLMLGACVPGGVVETTTRTSQTVETTLPAMKSFSAPQPTAPKRSNKDIVREFIDLSFQLESGRNLPYFTRFEGPISVAVTGKPSPTLIPDLNRLIQRLRKEAGIDISLSSSTNANITIQAVSRKDIRRYLPQAACFVVPNISKLSDYRAAARSRITNWSMLRERTKVAIFLPNDVSPQETRDCLHEELAQALGPLNDLYRLPDSVFNDDNVHTVLTGYDMLILRVYYDEALKTGMNRGQVKRRVPSLLAKHNPRGETIASKGAAPTSRDWINAIQTALGPGTGPARRRSAAQKALNLAQAFGWTDHRRAFSHFAVGRLAQYNEPGLAVQQFLIADEFYKKSDSTHLHRAYTASQLAAFEISQGRGENALNILNPHLKSAQQYENAALLATLLLLRAEALELEGRATEAQTIRLDSLGWARYGFGSDWAVRSKLREISKINPVKGSNGS